MVSIGARAVGAHFTLSTSLLSTFPAIDYHPAPSPPPPPPPLPSTLKGNTTRAGL